MLAEGFDLPRWQVFCISGQTAAEVVLLEKRLRIRWIELSDLSDHDDNAVEPLPLSVKYLDILSEVSIPSCLVVVGLLKAL